MTNRKAVWVVALLAALAAHPAQVTANSNQEARDAFNRGYAYLRYREYDRAHIEYTIVLMHHPNFVNALINRGLAYVGMRNYDRAIADFSSALRVDPNNAYARSSLTYAEARARQLQQQQIQPAPPAQAAQLAGNPSATAQASRPAGNPSATAQTSQLATTLPEGLNIEINNYVTYTPGAGVTIFNQIRVGQARSAAPPEQAAALIAEEIERLGLQGVFVREVEDGVMISLENIHFYGDTYILRFGGREEIYRIAEILRLFPGRNFLVAGHVNLGFGLGPWRTEEGRMQLSIHRANVVANYLIRLNIPADRITIRGYGATRMIASHTGGEAWRNKRAEITILDN